MVVAHDERSALRAIAISMHWLTLVLCCVCLMLIVINWTLEDIETRVSMFGLALRLARPRDVSGAPANPATARAGVNPEVDPTDSVVAPATGANQSNHHATRKGAAKDSSSEGVSQ